MLLIESIIQTEWLSMFVSSFVVVSLGIKMMITDKCKIHI
jgi:hypothetical protein